MPGSTAGPTPGLNSAPPAAATRLPAEVAALAYPAPAGCRWNSAGAPPVLECLTENAVWRPVEDAGITPSTVDEAARGDALAMANLGYFYDVQPAPIRNRAEAVRLYRGAADQGVAIARYNLAVLYQSGVPGVIEPDAAEARRYLAQAADQGLAVAMRRLAEQAGKSSDFGLKGEWYLRAAQAGDVPSMGKVAEFYRTGDGGLARDPAAAIAWARQADDHGDPWGRYVLGVCFEAGDGELAPDPAEAYRLFRIAAEAGVTPAMARVGEYLYQGWGAVPRDDREALNWLERAAGAGDPRAEYYLALFHLDGLAGLTPDPAAAAALMLTSAQAGDARAMFRTGRNYEIGIGVGRDLGEATRWYHRAAEAGDPDARTRLDSLAPY
jgi:TPR repeat protein